MPPGISERVNASLKEKPLGLSRRYRIRMQRHRLGHSGLGRIRSGAVWLGREYKRQAEIQFSLADAKRLACFNRWPKLNLAVACFEK
jgi:hypothetical protein